MPVYKVSFKDNVPQTATIVRDRTDANGPLSWRYLDKAKTIKAFNWVLVMAGNENEAMQKAIEKIQRLE
jgi:hypothetical protein